MKRWFCRDPQERQTYKDRQRHRGRTHTHTHTQRQRQQDEERQAGRWAGKQVGG